jgi:hypothetical protein
MFTILNMSCLLIIILGKNVKHELRPTFEYLLTTVRPKALRFCSCFLEQLHGLI